MWVIKSILERVVSPPHPPSLVVEGCISNERVTKKLVWLDGLMIFFESTFNWWNSVLSRWSVKTFLINNFFVWWFLSLTSNCYLGIYFSVLSVKIFKKIYDRKGILIICSNFSSLFIFPKTIFGGKFHSLFLHVTTIES